MKLYAQINKIDEDQRMVWGYATTGARDSQGEIVATDAIKTAWADYMKFANIREMHQPSAVGVVKEYDFDDVGVMIGAKVVDDTAWQKVKEQVYKGFSIGGKKLPGGFDPVTKTITSLQLTEISLVDRPANPESLISMFKIDDAEIQENQPMAEIEKGVTVTVNVDNQDTNDQKPVRPDAATGGNSASEVKPFAEVLADESPVDADDQKPKATEKDPKDAINSNNELNAPANRGEVKSLRKGMYEVSELAELIQCLQWAADGARYERRVEGDNSQIPERLDACIQALAQVFLDMAAEELKELQPLVGGGSALDQLSSVIANIDSAPSLTKKELATSENTFNKFDAAIEGLSKQVGDLRTDLQKANKTIGELQKRAEKQPTEPKGALRVIEKSADIDGHMPIDIDPVLKNDGSIDELATSIKKAQQTSQFFLARR